MKEHVLMACFIGNRPNQTTNSTPNYKLNSKLHSDRLNSKLKTKFCRYVVLSLQRGWTDSTPNYMAAESPSAIKLVKGFFCLCTPNQEVVQ